MQRDALHLCADILHQYLSPLIVVVRGTRGNAIELVARIVAQIGIELAVLVGIVVWTHVTATAPRLITDAEVLHLPSLVATVLTT